MADEDGADRGGGLAGPDDRQGRDRGGGDAGPLPPLPGGGSSPHLGRRSFLGAASGAGLASLLAPTVWSPARAADPWDQADAIVRRIRVPTFRARDFLITRYGAEGDGRTDCTAAIARAIDACNGDGGGRVVVPRGTFLTGAVHLKSNVNLHVDDGATLRFSTDPKKYLPVVLTSWEAADCYNYSPLIYAFRQTNVAVTGGGTLDGQAGTRAWWPWVPKAEWGWRKGDPQQGRGRSRLYDQCERRVPVAQRVYGTGYYLRPAFIEPYGCTNVLIEGVTLKNPPFWQIHPLFSKSVTVRNVKVASHGPNDDGSDIECCEDVLFQGCHFDTKDDCIAIKSGRGQDGLRRRTPSRNIVVRSCRVSQGGGAIAIGSEQAAGVSDVFVEDLVGDDPRLFTAVLIKALARFGAGTVERIHMRDFRLAGVKNSVITMTHYYGGSSGSGPYRPVFRDINLSGFTCAKSQNALAIRGLPSSPIRSVRLADSTFERVEGAGVIKQNVEGLVLVNVKVNGRQV